MRAVQVRRILMAVCCASSGASQARAAIPESLGWYEIPNTAIGDVCEDGVNSCGGIFAWSSGVMDTLRNRLIVWGGGHSDYSGNEIYALNLSGTPFFERLTDSTAGGCSSESCDGGLTPNSRHTYDGIEYMPNVDRMFVKGGSPAGVGWCASDCEPSTWTFDFATETWRGMSPSGPNPTSGFGNLSAYDPNGGRVIFGDLSDLYAYDFATDTYELLGSQNGNVGYWGTAVIDPVRKKLVVLGGGESGIYDISGNGSYSRQPLVTTGGDSIREAGYPGLAYHPVTDRIVAWAGGDTVYSLNLDTNTWTPATFPGGPGEQNGTGTYSRWSYAPALGVFVLVNSLTQNAFTFRLTPGVPDTQPPSAPANLTADAAHSSRINLTWIASTDNSGVASYEVERCEGASCTAFAPIAAIPGTTYSDAGLRAETAYRYRVRARDFSANVSSYSLIAEATTPPPDVPPPGGADAGAIADGSVPGPDGSVLGPDASLAPPDGSIGAPDAGPSPDPREGPGASGMTSESRLTGGCDCRTTGATTPAAAWFWLFAAVVVARAVRRSRR